MNNYGWNISEYANDLDKCTDTLSRYLNKGQLGLILGAGASIALGLPSWKVLVDRCIKVDGISVINVDPDARLSEKILAKKFKKACPSDLFYLNAVKSCMYDGINFDFAYAKKEMLIALTSLMVGRERGNVTNIITYNFDSVLEWYLNINGLSVTVVEKNHLKAGKGDVDIFHVHGYLPKEKAHGKQSDEIVFSEDEFEVRERGTSYWKVLLDDFYKRKIFLTIGVSPESICDDLVPYLSVLDAEWYDGPNKIERGHPYGICFLSGCSPEQEEKMLDNGVIPCVINCTKPDYPEIPAAIFGIAQRALANKNKVSGF